MTVRQRSTAYPSLALQDAVTLVGRVRDGLGSGPVTRDQIAPVIGHEKVTGPAASKIAAMAHYGLLDKGGGRYRVTTLAMKILTPTSEEERAGALREAALTPSLFSALYERFAPDGQLPGAVEAIMHREYGLTKEAAKTAHDNMVRSLAHAGLLNETTRRFIEANRNSQQVEDEPRRSESQDERGKKPNSSAPRESQVYEIPLSGGVAKVMLPPRLSQRDFETVKSLVDFMKHFVVVETAGGPHANAAESE